MDTLFPLLRQLGLTDNEIKIYLSLTGIGTAPASTLALRNKLKRSTTQNICKQLTEKGLFRCVMKGNTFLYTIEDPEQLHTLLEMEKKQIKRKELLVSEAIKGLKNIHHPYGNMPKVKYFEGSQGIIDMFRDVIKEGKTIYGMVGISKNIDTEVMNYIETEHKQKRMETGNKAFFIIEEGEIADSYRSNDSLLNRTTLIMKKDAPPIDISFHIYGNKVAFYSYERNDLTGVIIENEHIRAIQIKLFLFAWNTCLQFEKNIMYKNRKIDNEIGNI